MAASVGAAKERAGAMTTYVVMSQQPTRKAEETAAEPVVETRRTDRKIAEQDVEIIKTILHRSAWIVEP